jgi:hypothetical protein
VKARYRREEGEPCIDIAVESSERLFDNRDPAPFRERDLQPLLSEYLTDCADDLLGEPKLRVRFWLTRGPSNPEDIRLAYQSHFEEALLRLDRRSARRIRLGVTTLVIAVVGLVVLFALSQLLRGAVKGTVGTALSEGIVILGWVVLWRPADVLLYEWIPIRRERRVITKLLAADVKLHVGPPPPAPAP